MTRRAIYSGSKFEEMAGYARAVVDGRWVFVSGTAGYDPATMVFPPDPADQARRALQTIAEALARADATLADVVQLRLYLSDKAHMQKVAPILGETFKDPRPTNTTVICGFPVDEIKVEIEVVALKADTAAP